MMPAGRPEIKIDPREVRRLASRGLTLEQIAASLGIAMSTLTKQKAKYSEIAEAVKQGQARGISLVANALFEKARAGDTTAAVFYLKARAGWKDRFQISGDEDNPLRHVVLTRPLTDKEWEEKYGDKKESS